MKKKKKKVEEAVKIEFYCACMAVGLVSPNNGSV